LTIITTSLPQGVVGEQYSVPIVVTGGTGNYTFTMRNLDFFGLSIDSHTGIISGVVTNGGSGGCDVTVSDGVTTVGASYSFSAVNGFTIYYQPTYNFIVNQNPQSGINFTPVNGTPPYTATLVSGTIPPGMHVTVFGQALQYGGTPNQVGSYTMTVSAHDSAVPQHSMQVTSIINVVNNVVLSTTALKQGYANHAYTDTVIATQGTPPYHFSLSGFNDLLTINSNTGVISGILGSQQYYFGSIAVSDSATPVTSTTSALLNVFVNSGIGISPTFTNSRYQVGNDVNSISLGVSGGLAPYRCSISDGTLPPGVSVTMKMDFQNVIRCFLTGAPTQPGNFKFKIHAIDSLFPPFTSDLDASLPIYAMNVQTARIPNALLGSHYQVVFDVADGTTPLHFNVVAGSLPPGLILSGAGGFDGVINGTPTVAGDYPFTIQVKDSGQPSPQTKNLPMSIHVSSATQGRNDSIQTATSISNGQFLATFSPLQEAPDGSTTADQDYYKLLVAPGSINYIGSSTFSAPPNTQGSFSAAHAALEILDANGIRYTSCAEKNSTIYDAPCNGFDPQNLTYAGLTFTLPSNINTPTEVYLHYFDYLGRARPDFYYQVIINSQPAAAPQINASPTKIDFTGLPLIPINRSLLITNIGDLPVTMTYQSSGAFQTTTDCPNPVVSGSYCHIFVQFTAVSSGTYNGEIDIQSTALSSPMVIPLTGIGVDFSISPSRSTRPHLSQNPSTPGSAQYQLDFSSVGPASQSIQFSCEGLPEGTACLISPASLTLGTQKTIQVIVFSAAAMHRSMRLGSRPAWRGVKPGNYSFNVVARLGTISKSISLPLSIH